MARQHHVMIADQRPVTARLQWLALESADLARDARPGHFVWLRCDDPGDANRLLRRPLYVAATMPELGQAALLYEPSEPGLAWLARRRPGETLDLLGTFGRALRFDGRPRNLLLIGAGAGLAALLFAARTQQSQAAVTLLAVAADREGLPPAYLLPDDAEYLTAVGEDMAVAVPTALQPASGVSPLAWADAIVAALPRDGLMALGRAVQTVRFRWPRGFAQATYDLAPGCAVGACGGCAVALRGAVRLPCVDGPWFDLRDLE